MNADARVARLLTLGLGRAAAPMTRGEFRKLSDWLQGLGVPAGRPAGKTAPLALERIGRQPRPEDVRHRRARPAGRRRPGRRPAHMAVAGHPHGRAGRGSGLPRLPAGSAWARGPPPVLFMAGAEHIPCGGLAVVGSRRALPAAMNMARHVGALAAAADTRLVSGGARGIDLAAIRGAQHNGGEALIVLPRGVDPHESAGPGLLVSAYEPGTPFAAWRAMERNRLIYLLSDAAWWLHPTRGTAAPGTALSSNWTRTVHIPMFIPPRAASPGLCDLRSRGCAAVARPGHGRGLQGPHGGTGGLRGADASAGTGLADAQSVPVDTAASPVAMGALPESRTSPGQLANSHWACMVEAVAAPPPNPAGEGAMTSPCS